MIGSGSRGRRAERYENARVERPRERGRGRGVRESATSVETVVCAGSARRRRSSIVDRRPWFLDARRERTRTRAGRRRDGGGAGDRVARHERARGWGDVARGSVQRFSVSRAVRGIGERPGVCGGVGKDGGADARALGDERGAGAGRERGAVVARRGVRRGASGGGERRWDAEDW